MLINVGLLVLSLLFCAYYFVSKKYYYWKRKGVPHIKPTFLFGNYKDFILLKKSSPRVAHEICQQFPNTPCIGSYYGTEPALIVQDPEWIRQVLVKDFHYFSGREVSNYYNKEFVTRSMFFVGGDSWTVTRHNLLPIFSPAKMKAMFYLIEKCCGNLEQLFETETRSTSTIELKSTFAKYTMDCIGSCIFGIDICSLKNNKSATLFSIIGKKIFQESTFGGFSYMCRSIWPSVFYGLGFKLYDNKLCDFFRNLVGDVFKSRENMPITRHDFIDFILTWKKNAYITGPGTKRLKGSNGNVARLEVNDDLLTGQCILFFGAGFDTSAITLSYTLFELAKNKEIQANVIEEVDEYFKRHSQIEYECLNELQYVDACVNEALRMYPTLGLLTREVMEDYTFPTGLSLEKGLRVHIPVYHVHYNAKFHPEPETYKPERFLGEEKKKILPHTLLYFGEGPRICIGERFARMMIFAALLTVFKNYKVELAENMPQKLTLEPKAFNTKPIGNIDIKFISRKVGV